MLYTLLISIATLYIHRQSAFLIGRDRKVCFTIIVMVCMYNTVYTRCWKYLPGRKINHTLPDLILAVKSLGGGLCAWLQRWLGSYMLPVPELDC